MSRRFRPLSISDLDRLPSECTACRFWESPGMLERRCGVECDRDAEAAWLHVVLEEWGEAGRLAYDDDEVLGFVKYAPSRYFPQALTFPSAPRDGDVPLIACLHVSPDARHHGLGSVLLGAALRDLSQRGERKVEAFAIVDKPAVLEDSPFMGIDFLLRHGFTVSRPDARYPLMQLELRALATFSENLEAVLESLRLPLRVPRRAPATWMKGHQGGGG